ncbi:MAG: GspE/PulE family protein [Tissierellia bacterium]|nr:GspE/PulE family protein [Tissierellia bacterium]
MTPISDILERFKQIAVEETEDAVILEGRPLRPEEREDLEEYLGKTVHQRVVETSAYGRKKRTQEPMAAEENSAKALVSGLLSEALHLNASDIHLEPYRGVLRVRFRVHGSLYIHSTVPAHLATEVITRIKIISGMDIGERRKPQDGRFPFDEGTSCDVRVSSIPTPEGENLVLRLLDQGKMEYSHRAIGLTGQQEEDVELLLRQPQGLILLCGPTGSGKTTTLYTFLQNLNTVERNIITIEDPIEYRIEGISQMQVNRKAGITFESALESMLRQDPEVLMIGEIRSRETAETALRAAITGHLVFSTLHTNSSPAALIRLLDMGVEGYMLSAGIIGIISQRLLRVLCPHCKEGTLLSDEPFDFHGEEGYRAHEAGCPHCHQGYVGRRAVFEVLTMSGALKRALRGPEDLGLFNEAAKESGFVRLKDQVREMILKGETTLEEGYRALTTLGE